MNSVLGAPGSEVMPPNIESSPEMGRSDPQVRVRCDLHRLSRFGANLSDAHSCFVFLPAETLATLTCSQLPADNEERRSLVLAGHHSLSSDVIADCRLPRGSGLIGWVSKHARSIHVSPFELDSRTLGIYSRDQQLKSFVGIPIQLDQLPPSRSIGSGVVACDSKKSFAFSKLHIKLLEDLAAEIANTTQLLMVYSWQGQIDIAWQTFIRRAEELSAALGFQSIQILRLKLTNFSQLERILGTAACLALNEQLFRLIQQALPPHLPVVRLVNGDIILCIDNMMTSFYENKIRALCERVSGAGPKPLFDFTHATARDKKRKFGSVESLVAETVHVDRAAIEQLVTLDKELGYEYRRA